MAEDILAQSLVSVIDTRDEKLRFEIGARSTESGPFRCPARGGMITEWERTRNVGTAALG